MANTAKTRVAAPTALATEEQETSTNDSSKSGPIWKKQSGRVQGAIWRHPQKDKTIRYTVAISRSYFDRKDADWKSVHFFDEGDLADVEEIRKQAQEFLSPAETK